MAEGPGHFDHLVDAGLLDESFRGRLSPEEERRRAVKAEVRRRLGIVRDPQPEPDPGPNPEDTEDAADEIELPPPLALLPDADAIAALVAPWVSDPGRAPPEIVHEARVLHHYARAALMAELPDDPTHQAEEPPPEHEDDDAQP